MTATNILLVGCGNLGRALLSAWLKNPQLHFVILETEPSLELLDLIEPNTDRIVFNPTSAFSVDVAVFAVKPQIMEDVLSKLGHSLPTYALAISVAAGKRLAALEKHLQDSQAIVRAMPNVAARIGEAITVCVANRHATREHRETAQRLLAMVGKVEWVEDENLLDPVTAVSASGSAYVFLLVEELTKAAINAGLPPELAAKLARQTVIGAGMLLKNAAATPEELRNQVTSPGGTTEATLNVLMGENGLQDLITKAIKAATERAKQLAD